LGVDQPRSPPLAQNPPPILGYHRDDLRRFSTITTPQITTTPKIRRSVILVTPITAQALAVIGSTRSHAAAPLACGDWLRLGWLDDPIGLLGLDPSVKHLLESTSCVSVHPFF